MLGYESALEIDPKYAVSSPKANYYGEYWIFNDLNFSLNTGEDFIFKCDHNVEWEGKCSTKQIASVKCHQSKLIQSY